MPYKSIIPLYFFALFFVLAGINHFRVPDIYLSLIPPMFPMPAFLNYLTGAAEVVGGILLCLPSTRRAGALLIIVLLIHFIPAHIYMIRKAPFFLGDILISPLIAWLRLPIQGLLIWWASRYR